MSRENRTSGCCSAFQRGVARCLLLLLLIISVPGPARAEPIQEQGMNIERRGLFLTTEEKVFLIDHPVLSVTNEFDWPPFDFVTAGKPAGFGVELMALVAQRAGFQVRFINGYTWDELTDMFFKGRIDVIHSLSVTPEREKLALFSPPYYHSKNVLIFRQGARDINDLPDLYGRIVALPQGWSSIEFLEAHHPEIHIIQVASSRQALEYVDQGKVDATLEQEGIARYFIRKFGFTDLVLSGWIKDEELQKTSSMHFAVLKSRPVLFSILEKALKTVRPEELAGLEEKWLSRSGREIGREDVGLTPEERQWLLAKTDVKICILPDRMPFSHITHGQSGRDRADGMVGDLLEILQEKLDISFIPVAARSWDRAQTHLNTGVSDVIAMISRTPGRGNVLDFTAAFMDHNLAVITRDDAPFVAGLKALAGRKTGIVGTGNVRDIIMDRHPDLKPLALANASQCLLRVSSGQLDAAILSLPVASHYIREMGLTNLKVAGHTHLSEDFRLAVPKQDKRLHSIMSKAVRSLSLTEMDGIFRKWAGAEPVQRTDYRLVWQILAAAAVVLGVVGLWNRKLIKLNREIARANRKLSESREELKRISITDSLTGVYNRGFIEEAMEKELKRTIRHKRSMAVILMDIDFFKAINDNLGHQAGDAVLRQLTSLVRKNIRATDALGRWGGEEFLIVCPEISGGDAVHQARKLCRKIAATHFVSAGRQTASFGVTGFKQGDDSQALIRRADKALYQAKANGRNRVEIIQ